MNPHWGRGIYSNENSQDTKPKVWPKEKAWISREADGCIDGGVKLCRWVVEQLLRNADHKM